MSEKTTDQTPATEAATEDTQSPRARFSLTRKSAMKFARRCAYRIFRLAGEFTAIVLGTAFLWFYTLNALLAQQTLDVSFLKPNTSLWFAKAFEGRSANIEDMTLMWRPEIGSIVLRASDIVVDDADAEQLQNITELQAAFAFDEVITGVLKPNSIEIVGGAVTWRRNEDGSIVAGLGTPQTVGQIGTFMSEDGSDDAEREPFTMSGLKSLQIKDTDVYVQSRLRGLDFKLEQTNLTLLGNGATFDLQADALMTAGNDVSPVELVMTFSPDLEDFDLDFKANDFNGAKFVPKADMLAISKRMNAPANIQLGISAERSVGLKQVALNIDVGSGFIEFGSRQNRLEGFTLSAEYDPDAQTLRVDEIDLKSDVAAFKGRAEIGQIGRPATGFFDGPVMFEASLEDARVDFGDTLDNPLSMSSFATKGKWEKNSGSLDLETIKADFSKFKIDAQSRIEGTPRGGLTRLAGRGSVAGDMTSIDLLSLWPTEFATGARRWIDKSILRGKIQNLNFSFDVPEAAFSGAPLDDDDLSLTFDVTDADVKYISTMPAYANVSGSGILRGNSFDVLTNSGEVGGLKVSRGHVNIPRLNPHGGDFTIKVSGQGGVQDMLTLIDQKPFGFASRYGIDPNSFSGTGNIDLTITRPLLEHFDNNRILYSVKGNFDDVSVPFEVGPHRLEKGQFSLKADKFGMMLNGPVNLGPWRADMAWEQKFSSSSSPTVYKLSGLMDRDTLDGFGVGLREYFGGEIEVVIDALGRGLTIKQSTVKADLKKADIRIGEYWSKAPGVAANLTASLSRDADDAIEVDDMKINAPGLSLEGHLGFAPDMQLKAFVFSKAEIDGFVDGNVRVTPNADRTAFNVEASGDYLDISPFVSQAVAAQTSSMSLPMNLNVDVARLALSEMFILEDAKLNVEHNGIGTKVAKIMGEMGGGTFLAELTAKPDESGRHLIIDIPDASIAATAFLKSNNIRGGRLHMTADLPNVGEDGALTGVIDIEDAVLVRAPILAQMLSLASLKGLTDTMGGAGLEFRQVNIPFSYEGGDLNVRDGRASGPALGLTGSGDISFPDKFVDFDGVLVPAYTANSVLESIPVIGNIFVGKKGEGIFALSYAVKGPFSATQVGVNPLSALTPGFLRRIFDTQRDDLPEAGVTETKPIAEPPNPDGPR